MTRAARFKTGSVVFDKRRKTWHYLWWQDGKRRSRLIGTLKEFQTKSAAQREAQSLQLSAIKTSSTGVAGGPTVKEVAVRYEQERFPSRRSTARVYRSWLHNYVLREWGDTPISDVNPLAVEQWLNRLKLAPKSKVHVRNMLHLLIEFAMFAGVMEIARNPIELVKVKGGTKRTRKPRILTVDEFKRLSEQLKEPFCTIALLCVCLGLRISNALP
jgi:hypothetical protein